MAEIENELEVTATVDLQMSIKDASALQEITALTANLIPSITMPPVTEAQNENTLKIASTLPVVNDESVMNETAREPQPELTALKATACRKRTHTTELEVHALDEFALTPEASALRRAKRVKKTATTPGPNVTSSGIVLKSSLRTPRKLLPAPSANPMVVDGTETTSEAWNTSSVTPAENPNVFEPLIAEIIKSVRFEVTRPRSALFCCGDLMRIDPNSLYNCDSKACVHRQAIVLFAKELKAFNLPIPVATDKLLQQRDFMIQVLKYVPATVKEYITASRIKTTTIETTSTAVDRVETDWRIDLDYMGPGGRFFTQSANGVQKRKSSWLVIDDNESIWAEVDGMGVGAEGEKRLMMYERMSRGYVEFECEFHQVVKWVCNYWAKKNKALD